MTSPRDTWLELCAGCATIPDALERGLEKWASAPSDLTRAEREAWLADFSANLLVENTLTKMAAQNHLHTDEVQFLRELHAEAALESFQKLTKVALSPTAWGTLGGTVIGAGLGALKDDENRLRGAAIGAVPGAAIGALAGHGWGSWQQNRRDLSAQVLREAEDRAKQEALREGQQLLLNEKIEGQRDMARKAEEALKVKREADDKKKLFDQQAAERWHRSATSAASDLLQEYAQAERTDPTTYSPLVNQTNALLQHLHKNKDHIVNARIARPGDPVIMADAIPGYHGSLVSEIQSRASKLYKSLA